jgi:hypothetical protein
MKTNVPALAFLAAIIPACAFAQQTAPQLPTMDSVRAELGRAAVSHEADVRANSPASTGGAACVAIPSGTKVGRGVFANDYTVEANGQELGKIQNNSDSLTVVAKNGAVLAHATIATSGTTRTATITGCGGAPIGIIEELVGPDSSAFNFKDATGKPIATSGWVSGGSLSASHETVSLSVEQKGMFDNFVIGASGIDPQVAVIAAVMNNAAGYHRSAERRRDRIGDGPHGRGDR